MREQLPHVTFGTQAQVPPDRQDADRAVECGRAGTRQRQVVTVAERQHNALVIAGGVLLGTVRVMWHGGQS